MKLSILRALPFRLLVSELILYILGHFSVFIIIIIIIIICNF